jgi:hypothetical protein
MSDSTKSIEDVEARPVDESRSKPGGSLNKLDASFRRYEQLVGLEGRGIARVDSSERHKGGLLSHIQIFLVWTSINLATNNITLGMLGPSIYILSFKDASLCATFGAILGSLPVAYMATSGALSGNRTMVSFVYELALG